MNLQRFSNLEFTRGVYLCVCVCVSQLIHSLLTQFNRTYNISKVLHMFILFLVKHMVFIHVENVQLI